ncbi:MAG: hypothetical protein FJZ86_03240 [Chloroflexi bacterium]|nr:hypothetical protein [Chloroflexota bacterium]
MCQPFVPHSRLRLLNYIIEQISGQSYGMFLQRHIFELLEMTQYSYDCPAATSQSPLRSRTWFSRQNAAQQAMLTIMKAK